MAGNADVTVLVVGKTGAGKSALFKNLLEEEKEESGFTFVSNTESIEVGSTKWGSITISIMDTPNLMKKDQVSSIEKKLMFDLVIFCIPVSPGSKFEESNPEIMKWLHYCYGANIWKRCVIVFTFSNMAKDHACSSAGSSFEAENMYTDYLKEHLHCFQSFLRRNLHVDNDVLVTLWENGVCDVPEPRIVAIPAGYASKDPVLPKYEVHKIEWRVIILSEIFQKSKLSFQPLKVYNSKHNSIYYYTAAGGAIGTLVGGPIGGVVGMVLVGAVVGAALGATAGGLIWKYT